MPDGAALPAARSAYAALYEHILSNVYAPSQSVSIAEVTADPGMSRMPLRDARIRLEEERLIELVPRQGFRVLPVHPSAMRETYEVLAGLEGAAIELLITRGPNEAERAALVEVSAALERALDAQDLVDTWAAAHKRYHDVILSSSGNQRLLEIARGLLGQTRRACGDAAPAPLAGASTRAHPTLVGAILAGDVGAACDNHLRQRLRSARELTEILERLNIRVL
ncbi:GntR family transcriptional regulator [Roseomonas sp. GCM10028921]